MDSSRTQECPGARGEAFVASENAYSNCFHASIFSSVGTDIPEGLPVPDHVVVCHCPPD